MATYTPGLKVVRQVRHRVRRVLPIAGDVLVKVGDRVDAEQIVAQTFMPGDVTPLNLANVLSISPGEVKASLLKPEGEKVEVGEVLARTKGIFGLFKNEYRSKSAGTIESVSAVTGQVILRGKPIPVQVRAYLTRNGGRSLSQRGSRDRGRRHADPRNFRHRWRSVRADHDGLPRSVARADRRADHSLR